MLNYIFKFAAIWVIMSLAGCIGMVSTSYLYGGGFGECERSESDSTQRLYLPMNFVIRAKEKYDLRQQIGKVSNERVKEFVSIGIRALSNEFGFEANAWDIITEQDIRNSLEQIYGLPANNTKLDDKLTLELLSPLSPKINLATATPGQAYLIATDLLNSIKFDYRAKFSGTVSASLRTEASDRIFFDIDMCISVERKSSFADTKHFYPFTTIDQNAVQRLRVSISDMLLQAYYEALNNYGFTVEKDKQ
jgi:hypothetical protein